MSQQEMQFGDRQQNEQKAYNSGYEAFPPDYHDYEFNSFNQKIAGQQEAPESAHLREHRLNLRMGMAIVSLVFWMGFFLIGIALILNNLTVAAIPPIVFIGILAFTVLIIFANILINRKKI
jgi:hypothetical protein